MTLETVNFTTYCLKCRTLPTQINKQTLTNNHLHLFINCTHKETPQGESKQDGQKNNFMTRIYCRQKQSEKILVQHKL